MEILEALFFDGKSIREIAKEKDLSLAGMREHVDSILAKLGRDRG